MYLKHVNLILYRNSFRQKNQSVFLSFSNGVKREISVNSYYRLSFAYSGEPIKICADDTANCIYLGYSNITKHYLNCSLNQNSQTVKLEIEDPYLGEIHSTAALKAQGKRVG